MSKVFALCIFSLLFVLIQARKKSRNPCHNRKNGPTGASRCEGIVLPRNLCSSCQLSTYDSQGYFTDCSAIYRTSEPQCLQQLRYYSLLNPCDTVRREEVFNINDGNNLERLDYFVYAVCEECCDCVPKSSLVNEYVQRLFSGGLISLKRGNCPAHAHYDICKVWPEVRHVTGEGFLPDLTLPKVCPELKRWISSKDGKGWSKNQNVAGSPIINKFLNDFNIYANCREESLWKDCVELEMAQGRV